MEKYLALLRGVNVGGNNKVPMPLLKNAFEDVGFSQVSTYINSGNIIFSSEEKDIVALQQKCRNVILDVFGLDIAVASCPQTICSRRLLTHLHGGIMMLNQSTMQFS